MHTGGYGARGGGHFLIGDKTMNLICCHIDEAGQACEAKPEWVITTDKPYDDLHSCTAHVGHLLSDADRHYIDPIETVVAV